MEKNLNAKDNCEICNPVNFVGEELVDRDGFLIYVMNNTLSFSYNGEYEGQSGYRYIKFCPECGRKLTEE